MTQGAQEPVILIIDDEPLVRESLAAFLDDSGFSVLEAEDGKQGLEKIRADKPDVVLCDLHMPVMNGLDLLKILEHDKSEIPFIVVSGANVIHDAVSALHLGAWDYIIKPITDMGTLEHAVNRSLDRKRLLDENKKYRDELEQANQSLKQSLEVLEEDQAAGRTVQFSLLPEKKLSFDQYSFERTMIPSLYLSGDFVDYFRIDQSTLGFYIADVSGHGAPSAFVTVLLHSLINQIKNKYGSGDDDDVITKPGELLQYLNRQFYQAKFGKYVTMVYCVIDTEHNTLSYSVGGHYPNPILISDGQAPIYIEGSGFPVGVTERAEYITQQLSLSDDFQLVMFSDGVLEIVPRQRLDDQEIFLLDMFAEGKAKKVDVLASLGLSENENKELPDDITFLIVSRQAESV